MLDPPYSPVNPALAMLAPVPERPMLVTPEAVELHLDTAGLGSRVLATLIDLVVMVMLFSGLMAAVGIAALGDDSGTVVLVAVAVGIPIVLFGYPIASETLWRGRTIGKSVMGLRVVTSQGSPIRLRHAAIRAFVGLIDFQLTGGLAAVVSVLASREGRRLGDMAAGTLVIRSRRVVGRTAVPVAFIPHSGSEDFTRTLDVSRVDNEMHQAIRSFLLRVQDLSPEVRWALAVKFGTAAARRLKVSPPADMHPETFLVSVLSACQHTAGGAGVQAWPQQPIAAWAGRAVPDASVAPVPATTGSVWVAPNPSSPAEPVAEPEPPPSTAPEGPDDGFSAPN